MKILLLTQWYDPEPTFKGQTFARALHDQGHDVQVITGFPNYPGGNVYPGYRIKWLQREMIDGVQVCRVPLYPSHDGSGVGRALNYISFAAASSLFGVFAARRPDVIYAYHPPLTVGMSAALIGFFRRTPVVYDIQDMWPDTLKATGMLNNPRALSLIGRICQWVYRRASALVVLSPGFKQLLLERGVAEEKISVIYNWCDAAALTNPQSHQAPAAMQGRFNVVFAGTMGKAQALDAVINAAALVAARNPAVQFVFVGGGVDVDRLKSLAQQKSPSNVLFLPRMPMNEVGNVLNGADVLLVHLRDDPLFAITVPSKTQAYMAVGKPLLMAVRGDAADLVKEAGCGEVTTPENADELAAAVLRLASLPKSELDAMGKRGAAYYNNELSIDIGVERFLRVFEKVKCT